MSVRLPLTTVLDVQDNGNLGAASVAGGIPHTFYIPQDTDNVVVKLTASVAGGGISAIFQTTDDGGTTWYDVGRTSVVSNAVNGTAQWLNVGVNGTGQRTAATFSGGSIITAGIGAAAASTVAQGQNTGLPLLSTYNRVFLITTAATTLVTSVTTQVKVNSQSNNA